MEPSRLPSAGVAALGLVLGGGLLLAAASVAPLGGDASRVLASVGAAYLTCGTLVAARSAAAGARPARVRTVLGIAAVAIGVVVAVQLRSLRDADRLGGGTYYVWEQLLLADGAVTAPFVAATFLPLGVARTRREAATVLGLTAVPFLLGVVHGVLRPPEFGLALNVLQLLGYYLVGAIAGLPLYAVGRSLRDGDG